jgi:hypothetical protein
MTLKPIAMSTVARLEHDCPWTVAVAVRGDSNDGGFIMRLGKVLASAAVAASLVSAPIAAQASVADVRAESDIQGENIQGGWFIPALAIIAVLVGIWILVDDSDGDRPTSP